MLIDHKKDTQEFDQDAKDVMAFLSKELALPLSAVRPQKRIRQDLNIDGPDAWQLIESFAAEFVVDVDDFRYTDYFGQTPQPQWASFILGLFGNARPLRTLYVADLVQAKKIKFIK
jgi:hypothetical protein